MTQFLIVLKSSDKYVGLHLKFISSMLVLQLVLISSCIFLRLTKIKHLTVTANIFVNYVFGKILSTKSNERI